MSANSLSFDNPQSQQFNQLLGEVKQEVDGLKAKIDKLENEKKQLRNELLKLQKKQNDPFSSIENKDRMVMKQQIEGLISKIDKHLNIER